jgi:4-amino-4-deoxy-L-arabinose transferase-like glycosyltransferase
MPANASSPDERVWRLAWLTPTRCRLILAAVLLLGFLGHLAYLTGDCPLDLSGDEAHYWDWSRQLDLSYYSKGPLVAYIIRASCALFGDTMWAVRLPALVLSVGTGLVTYLLTRKLFGSERLALGAVLLSGLVPMFIAGSVVMTIDPPFFFCWALATYLLAVAIFDGRRWCWPVIGVVVGVGFLAKYAMFLWLPSMLLALRVDPRARPLLRTARPWVAVAVALVFTTPVVVWNSRNGWVSARHVATQTGADEAGRFAPMNFPEFVGGQVGVLGPPVAVLMAAAAVYGWSRAKRGGALHDARAAAFLLAVGLPILALTAVNSFRAKVQPNWPAPAYFTLLILTAYFVATRLRDRAAWKPWRPWVWAAVVLGLIATPVLHHTESIYPLVRWANDRRGADDDRLVRRIDPTVRPEGLGGRRPSGVASAGATRAGRNCPLRGLPNDRADGVLRRRPAEDVLRRVVLHHEAQALHAVRPLAGSFARPGRQPGAARARRGVRRLHETRRPGGVRPRRGAVRA